MSTPSVTYKTDVVNDSNDKEKLYFGLADTTLEILNMRSTKTAQN